MQNIAHVSLENSNSYIVMCNKPKVYEYKDATFATFAVQVEGRSEKEAAIERR